jgi:CheY-like chemotaxis protein
MPKHSTTKIVLVVDDEPGIRLMIRDRLEHERYTVAEAENGRKALEKLQAAPSEFCLVISDVNMPEKNGFELVREMKNDPELRAIPVMMMTGISSNVTAFTNGEVLRWFHKPFSPAELAREVRERIPLHA